MAEVHRVPPRLPSSSAARHVSLEPDYLEVTLPQGGLSGSSVVHVEMEDVHGGSVPRSVSPGPQWAPQHRPLCGSFATYRLE